MEQIELSNRMIDFGHVLDGYFTTLALQFGYMVLFGMYFPFGLFLLLIANIFMVALTAFAYSHHVKRSKSIKTNSIGVWKRIFNTIGYLGVMYNGIILIFPGNGLIPLFGNENNYRDAVLVLILEHLLIGFKALISWILEGMPSWVVRRIQKEKYREERHQERIISNYKDAKIKKEKEAFVG